LYIYKEVGANSFDTCILTTKIRPATQAALHAPQQALNAPVSPAKACGNTEMLPAPTPNARLGTRQ